MRLIFKHGMSDFEKNSRGPKIQQTLVQRFQGIFAWPTLIFNLNGVQLSFTPINIGFYYASTIGMRISCKITKYLAFQSFF